MKKAHIEAISYYLPEIVRKNEDISNKFPEWSVDKISAKLGILERHIAATEEFASDMAVAAVEKLFKETTIDRTDIDFLLYCTQSPDYFLPTTACILQSRLGLRKTVGALDFNLGCSGFVYGLSLAKGLIVGNMARKVLLVTSETYSKFIHPDDKSNQSIFGDAAAATIITDDGAGPVIGEFIFGTDGEGAENLIVKNGGMKNKLNIDTSIYDEIKNFIRSDNHLYMNGNEIFQFTVTHVPQLISQTLRKNNTSPQDVSMFVLHQANKFMLEYIRKKASIPAEKFFYCLDFCGNTVSSTIPISLHELFKSTTFNSKQSILLAGFGVGYSWSATLLSYE